DLRNQKLPVGFRLLDAAAGHFNELSASLRRNPVPLLQGQLDPGLIELHADTHGDTPQRSAEVHFKPEDPRIGRLVGQRFQSRTVFHGTSISPPSPRERYEPPRISHGSGAIDLCSPAHNLSAALISEDN